MWSINAKKYLKNQICQNYVFTWFWLFWCVTVGARAQKTHLWEPKWGPRGSVGDMFHKSIFDTICSLFSVWSVHSFFDKLSYVRLIIHRSNPEIMCIVRSPNTFSRLLIFENEKQLDLLEQTLVRRYSPQHNVGFCYIFNWSEYIPFIFVLFRSFFLCFLRFFLILLFNFSNKL